MKYFEEVRSSNSTANGHFKRDRTNNTYRNGMTKQGLYLPKYSISEVNFGTPEHALELEFSAGKLLHGTNFREVSQKDFPAIVDKLANFLRSIQVITDRSEITDAPATLAAYARNIPVGKFSSTSEILWVMGHFDYRPRSEHRKELREGDNLSELKYFNNNSHLTLYDKVLELQNHPITKEEREIVDLIKKGEIDETLRMELRFTPSMPSDRHSPAFMGKVKSLHSPTCLTITYTRHSCATRLKRYLTIHSRR